MRPTLIHTSRTDGIAVVVLTGRLLGIREAAEVEAIFNEFVEDDGLRVVVLRTVGPDFCAGPDVDLHPVSSGLDPAAAIASCRVPVIAQLTGAVASVGLELALACDIRIADSTATFSMPDLGAGRLPCWGGTQRLPRAAGRSAAARLLYTGEVFAAADALRCGLVHQVADELAAVTEQRAEQLAALAPHALAMTKEALRRGPEMPMRAALELEGDLNHLLQTTSDRAEGLGAFFAKRPPSFTGQ